MQSGIVRRHSDAVSFLNSCEQFLMCDEARYNSMISLAYKYRGQPNKKAETMAWFLTIQEDSRFCGAAAMTAPPNRVMLTQMSDTSAATIAENLVEQNVPVLSVLGPADASFAFANRFVALTGGTLKTGTGQAIYKLTRVNLPAFVAGNLRTAEKCDVPLLAIWHAGFIADTGIDRSVTSSQEIIERLIAEQRVHVWQSRNIMSMAAITGETPNGARIAMVYTPSENRHQGYASALVAGLSQHMLDSGRKFCFLYTDQNNPTSNKIYQQVGYEHVCNVIWWRFQ
jgi:uncharacterized protein